ncbi:putative FAD-dependent isoamyl alcohol oxidase [Xylaria cf. heliscus]|nr:putative FAD-dependent isoamyl alcohol oxidase [Xylaria cf. heliscus]
MMHHFFHLYLLGLSALFLFVRAETKCRYLPGDDGWPSADDWSRLNDTVQGRLIATVPQASVCRSSPYGNYNAAACASLQGSWTEAEIYVTKPAEIMNPYYQNQSCDPFVTGKSCELGNYAVYSVNVTGEDDVLAAVTFAKEKNIRLVIKSTGHDYNGKSTGTGALSLWMHNLKTLQIIEAYQGETYSGPAVKLGPGIIAGEAYGAIDAAGYRIVGGECASVSLAGGYTTGGGHSMLNTAYGMAADSVLEWEVVTPSGEYLVATPKKNADLYWALSGGGGGTYAVILSMTTKIYPDGPVASGALSFTLVDSPNESKFWEAIRLFFQRMPSLVSDRNTLQLKIENDTFNVFGITMPDVDISAVKPLVAPYLAELERLDISYTFTTNSSATYLDYFASINGPLPYGPYPPTEIWINRLVPLSAVLNSTTTGQLMDAFKLAVTDGTFLIGCNGLSVAEDREQREHPDNAVFPAWRDAIAACSLTAFWDYEAALEENLAVKETLVSTYAPPIEAVTPGSGVYLNEVDPWYKGDWKQEMYGENYDRLLDIKHKYDPNLLLYGHFAVGSDEFTIDGDGRLCAF